MASASPPSPEFSIRYSQSRGYILFEVSGQYPGVHGLKTLIHTIETQVNQRKLYKVMVDLCTMSGFVHGIDRYQLGEEAASIWPLGISVAIVYREDSINRFFETVTRNRGKDVMVFSDRSEAEEWLLRD